VRCLEERLSVVGRTGDPHVLWREGISHGLAGTSLCVVVHSAFMLRMSHGDSRMPNLAAMSSPMTVGLCRHNHRRSSYGSVDAQALINPIVRVSASSVSGFLTRANQMTSTTTNPLSAQPSTIGPDRPDHLIVQQGKRSKITWVDQTVKTEGVWVWVSHWISGHDRGMPRRVGQWVVTGCFDVQGRAAISNPLSDSVPGHRFGGRRLNLDRLTDPGAEAQRRCLFIPVHTVMTSLLRNCCLPGGCDLRLRRP
jgi:hypothetical protein